MCLFLISLIRATVAPAFIPGSTHSCYGSSLAFAGLPHTNEHLCDHVVITITLTVSLLSPRPGWNRRWCYHRQAPKSLCESFPNVGAVQSDIKPRATVASIKVLFRGINASIHTRFTLAHARALGILHCWKPHFSFIQGILPAFQLDATVRGAFMSDSTLEFLPILAAQNAQKRRYLVVFSTHSSGLALRNSLGAFRHKQDFHCRKHNF